MPRIIAGRAGSLVLDVPDAGTRPTSDRVRESLFGALESAGALHAAAVLDLYAGSGALGLEAVSRGAASLDLVEKNPRAASILKRNAAKVSRTVGGEAVVRVHRIAASSFLASPIGPYDLVFLDPPYDLEESRVTEALTLLVPSLRPGARVVLERAARSAAPVLPEALEHERHRRYGDTVLWWLRLAP